MFNTVLFLFLAFLPEIAGTVGGFGSSVFFVPMAQFFLEFKPVLMLTAILHVFNNTSKLYLFRKSINIRLLLLFGIPSIIFVIIGAYYSRYLQSTYTSLAPGIFPVV
jgi:Sulfite exporter TauE/SafE.